MKNTLSSMTFIVYTLNRVIFFLIVTRRKASSMLKVEVYYLNFIGCMRNPINEI